jgi:glutathione S-transferase
VAREAGISLELVKVNLVSHRLDDGSDYLKINPRGYVPALVLDDGSLMTEASVIVQFLADLNPASGLMPAAGSTERYQVQQWLAFISTELHKMFSPWLWHTETADHTIAAVKAKLGTRFAEIDRHLAGRQYLSGDRFTAADAYAFTIINWVNFLAMDLKAYPDLAAYMGRIANRPNARHALAAEGLARAA